MEKEIGLMYLALNDFEKRIIDKQIERLYEGREIYGPWKEGAKVLTKESAEEFLDAAQYMAAQLLEMEDAKCRKEN